MQIFNFLLHFLQELLTSGTFCLLMHFSQWGRVNPFEHEMVKIELPLQNWSLLLKALFKFEKRSLIFIARRCFILPTYYVGTGKFKNHLNTLTLCYLVFRVGEIFSSFHFTWHYSLVFIEHKNDFFT